ncbi:MULTISPECIES: GIY-YIG nuclease family protein [unclassified Limnospira]|uniref:GIY-YIG nuclease family protein n=2 Tax=Sirenicapillariaceae TaxID=2934961 RepID=UPI0037C121EE
MIYMILDRPYCKIGFSKHPQKRLKQLQTGNPRRLILLAVCNLPNSFEKEFHRFFKKYKFNNEWFLIPPNELDCILFVLKLMENQGIQLKLPLDDC